MSSELNLKEAQKEWHGTPKSYLIGFICSLLLTAASFILAAEKLLPTPILAWTLVVSALAQAVVQLLYFLHLGTEAKPRWELVTFYFMVLVLFIIALGSLWIMHDLDDRLMSYNSAYAKNNGISTEPKPRG